jgi:hypothetical protein
MNNLVGPRPAWPRRAQKVKMVRAELRRTHTSRLTRYPPQPGPVTVITAAVADLLDKSPHPPAKSRDNWHHAE